MGYFVSKKGTVFTWDKGSFRDAIVEAEVIDKGYVDLSVKWYKEKFSAQELYELICYLKEISGKLK